MSDSGEEAATGLIEGDCLEVLPRMESESFHMALTDPPYFLDGLDDEWRKAGKKATGRVEGLPPTMAFNRKQGERLYEFMLPVAQALFRVLKPGAAMISFSSPRLVHRLTLAFEEAGFEIRDQFIWNFANKSQFKAFSLDHFVERDAMLSESRKREIAAKLGGRRTPQLRPQFESIIFGQKPRCGTFIDNWLKHETGLIDPTASLDGKVPSTVMRVPKPERDEENDHLTPKPVRLCEHLIRLFTKEGASVIDPFCGSGTTLVAAKRSKRTGTGIEVRGDYVKIAQRRLHEEAERARTEPGLFDA